MRIESKFFNFSTGQVKRCDYCKSSPALLYCKVESAFTCIACDARAHDGAPAHARVWICEVCEHAPAAFTCKADAAALCVSCDRDIHSANPLAGRHERVPVVPFYDTAESVLAMKSEVADCNNHDMSVHCGHVSSNGSWTMNTPNVNSNVGAHHGKFHGDNADLKALEFLFSDSDQLLDFDNYQQAHFSDSVVPIQADVKPPLAQLKTTNHDDRLYETRFDIDFTRSTVNSYNHSYATANTTTAAPSSRSLGVSSSSMDVGVVPDGSSISDISNYPFGQNMSLTAGGGEKNMDREARVLRYKEKRKNRKFEKTIRYASRKAYAETRPRIKGRFAKRTDSESDLERIFAGDFVADARYGVVPSF